MDGNTTHLHGFAESENIAELILALTEREISIRLYGAGLFSL
jgi:hypothetical protein